LYILVGQAAVGLEANGPGIEGPAPKTPAGYVKDSWVPAG